MNEICSWIASTHPGRTLRMGKKSGRHFMQQGPWPRLTRAWFRNNLRIKMKNTKIRTLIVCALSVLSFNAFASEQGNTGTPATVNCSLTYHKMNPDDHSGLAVPGMPVTVTKAGVTTQNNGFTLSANLIPPGCGPSPTSPCWMFYRLRLTVSNASAANHYSTSFPGGFSQDFLTDLSVGNESAIAECRIQ